MRILITGAASPLGRALAAALGTEHELRTLDAIEPGDIRLDLIGDLRDAELCRRAVEGVEAILHLAALYPAAGPDTPPHELLDMVTRGGYRLMMAAAEAGVPKIVLASSLDLLRRYPHHWQVAESWMPRPTTDPRDLSLYLAEISAREFGRTEPMRVICLRLGTLVDDEEARRRAFDVSWLHMDDAVQAFRRALAFEPEGRLARSGWWVFHISRGGPFARFPLAAAAQENLGFAPQHDFRDRWPEAPPRSRAQPWPQLLDALVPETFGRIPSRPIRNVVIFGAGGPLASITVPVLVPRYRLRLTDIRPLEEVEREAKPQSPGAPTIKLPGPPHETRIVDVTDPQQVLAACEGMDAIINCTVIRPDPVGAFKVNLIGAYNVMRAAVAHRIRRVVHTGPQLVTLQHPVGYWHDFDVPEDAPPRPGTHLYGHTKYLGQEVCRIFAEEYGLEVPALLFSQFVNPETAQPRPDGVFPMTVSWEDAAQAMRLALEVPSLPRPFEVFHILTDVPHRKFRNDKAKRLLGWQPRDGLEHLWARRRE
jgi:nucleoside-diphosphate-sugar epimerase